MNKFLFLRFKFKEAEERFYEKLSKNIDSIFPFETNLAGIFKLSSNVIMASFQSADPFSCGPGFHIDGNNGFVFDGFSTINGSLVSTDGNVARNLLQQSIERENPNHTFNSLEGEYSLAFFNEAKDIICAFSDYSGLKPLFFIDNDHYTAVSNRQFLLNYLCTSHDQPEFDITASISLVTQGNKFGGTSLHQGVRLLTPGEYFESNAEGKLSIKSFDQQLWNIFDRNAPVNYDDATQSLIRNFDWLSNNSILNGKPLKISLTGGEDSRLVLAVALQSRAKSAISTFTYGYEDNPDILTAPIVAEAAGVPHEKIIHKRTPPGEANLDSVWKNLRSHAFRYEGMPGAWDGAGGPAKDSSLDITGLFDFFYKRVRPSNAEMDLQSLDETTSHFINFQQSNDPIGLLTNEQKSDQTEEIQSWILNKVSQGAIYNDLPEIYYQENRICWWAGIINSNIQSKLRISPLSSKTAAAASLLQKVPERRDRRFIFEVMQRTAPHLLEVPYLNKKWPASITSLNAGIRFPNTQFSFQSAPNSSVPWQVSFVKKGNLQIRDFLLDNNSTGIFDVYNKDKILRLLNDPTLITDTPTVKAILNIVQIQIMLTRSWTVEKDSLPTSNLKESGLKTNIPWLENIKNNFGKSKNKEVLKSQNRKIISVSIPEGAKNFRIDPASSPGKVIIYSVSIIDNNGNNYSIPLSEIRSNNQIKATLNKTLDLVIQGDDPHFFCKPPYDDYFMSAKKIIVDIDIPYNTTFEVFYDFGNGFTRNHMHSEKIILK